MLKSEVDAILNAGKNVKQQLHSFIALGNANGTVILEDSSAIPYKVKYSLALQSSNHTPQYLSK